MPRSLAKAQVIREHDARRATLQNNCTAATMQTMNAAPAIDPVASMKIAMNVYPGLDINADLISPATKSIAIIIANAKIPFKVMLMSIDHGTTIGAFLISSDIWAAIRQHRLRMVEPGNTDVYGTISPRNDQVCADKPNHE